MDIPCSSRPGWLAWKKYTNFPSSPSFGNAHPQWCGGAAPLASPAAAVTSVLDVTHSRGVQRFPKHKICCLPWAQKPLNYDTLVKRPLSKSGISGNKSSTALIHFSISNNSPFPLKLLMRNKGIKRDRNDLSFAQSWGTCMSWTSGKPTLGAAVMCKLAARLEKKA